MSESKDLDRLGIFSQPSLITVADPYVKKQPDDSRHKGKQFATSPCKKGKTAGYFDNFKPLFENESKGEKYQDPGTSEKEYRNQQKKKIKGGAFLPSSPSKKATGPGAYYGCFGKNYEHKTEFQEKKKKKPEPKNFMTSPGKRGTFGVPGTLLSKDIHYTEDPYDLPRQKEKEELVKKKKQQIAGPFRSMSHSKEFFDCQPNVPASRIYTSDRPLPPEKPKKPHKKTMVPFRPSSPPKRGYNSTFNKFPEYKEDPIEERMKKERDERRKAKPKVVFKPVSAAHSTPTRPILS